jgi:5,10-methenyltetrahydrofolate synthetase
MRLPSRQEDEETMEDNDKPTFASPPCFMHELDPNTGLAGFDPQAWRDVARWRKAERERLIAARLAVPAVERAAMGARIGEAIEALIGDPAGRVVSFYWPFRGEPDLRPLLARLTERGATAALPVVVEKHRPLVFRVYRPGDRLEKGVWNIPAPADGAEVVPDVVLAPVVGFDPQNYRLGYGGGFFDRTLASLTKKRFVIGLGYSLQRIPTIYPQPHDIVMDRIVTEAADPVSRD